MKSNKKTLIKSIAIPLLVGIISGLLTRGGMVQFLKVNQPPLTPPSIVFPIVWTILFTLMGISAYFIQTSYSTDQAIAKAMSVYHYQLLVNFLWPVFFFNLQWYGFSFLWLALLWVMVAVMIKQFYAIKPIAAYLNIPYLIWLTFAAYLNLGVWWLN